MTRERETFPSWDDRLRDDDFIQACHGAVRQWGEDAQFNKCAEESSELAAAINRLLNPESERNDPLEELIDARLVMEVVSTVYPTEELSRKMDEQVADFKRRVAEDSPDGGFVLDAEPGGESP